MKCNNCEHEFEKYEGYVVLEDGTKLDETCFFNMALEKLNAKTRLNDPHLGHDELTGIY